MGAAAAPDALRKQNEAKGARRLHPIGWFAVVTGLLWLVALAVPLLVRSRWYAGYPVSPLDISMEDLTIFRVQFFRFRQPDFYTVGVFPLTYPALAGMLLEVLFATRHAVRLYEALLAAGSVAGLMMLAVALARRGMPRAVAAGLAVFLGATAYPLFFCWNRGNIEFFNFALVAGGIALCWKKRWNRGGVLLGLAVAFKICPVMLLGFLLAQRKFKALGIALVTAAAANLMSLAILGPSIGEANRQIARGLQFFKTVFAAGLLRGAAVWDHSIFGAYKMLVHDLVRPQVVFEVAVTRYTMAAVVVAVAVYAWRVERLPAVSQVVVLTTLAILLPPVSYDYTLLMLYIPCALLAVEALKGVEAERRTLVWSFLCLAWTMAPLTYLQGPAGPLRCAGLVVLVVLHCVRPVGRDGDGANGGNTRLAGWEGGPARRL